MTTRTMGDDNAKEMLLRNKKFIEEKDWVSQKEAPLFTKSEMMAVWRDANDVLINGNRKFIEQREDLINEVKSRPTLYFQNKESAIFSIRNERKRPIFR